MAQAKAKEKCQTMLELYHFPNAICAHKVRVALAEKELPWESRIVNDPQDPAYLRLNPNGVVPTLAHDGRLFVESRIISEYLDEAFPARPLLSDDPVDRHAARLWSKQIDDSLHLHIFVITFAAIYRERFLSLPPEAMKRKLAYDPVKRRVTLDLLEEGTASPWFASAVQRFHKLVTDVDRALAARTWLAGDSYSLADTDFTAYFHRLNELGLSYLWNDAPHASDWFGRVRARPSYTTGILNWLDPKDRAAAEAIAPRIRDAARNAIPLEAKV
jgi:glutathione S-transferase